MDDMTGTPNPDANETHTAEGVAVRRFAFVAQSAEGASLDGTLRSESAQGATSTLRGMGLRVLTLKPVEGDAEDCVSGEPKTRPLGAADFASFNRQFAQLTSAGMPVASGLRMIAADVRRGRLARSIDAVADELEGGADLAEAFDRHRGAFPPLYAELIDAGVRTGRLPGVLLNLGEHLARVNRLRLALWRALAYPFVVLLMVLALVLMWSEWLAPEFNELYDDFGTELPHLTVGLLSAADWATPVVLIIAALLMGVPIAWWVLDRLGVAVLGRQRLLLRVPMLGSALSRSLLGRWCGMLHLGVDAGLDLPGALRMAGDASPSRSLRADADVMAAAIERGESLDDTKALRLEVVPEAVPASIQLGSEHADLPAMLENLAAMYAQHAELRLGALQAVLAPVMLVILAIVLGLTILAMFLPLIKLMSSLM